MNGRFLSLITRVAASRMLFASQPCVAQGLFVYGGARHGARVFKDVRDPIVDIEWERMTMECIGRINGPLTALALEVKRNKSLILLVAFSIVSVNYSRWRKLT
jgi:hypothetical protein